MPRWLYFLLIFTVLAPLLALLRVPAIPMFVVAGLGIVPLAALIGQSVEQVAEHTGERIGGLLFATFGNATELIIGIFALSEGLIDVVRASIIGSILGNVLLVLGVSTTVGCIKHGRLNFETRPASQYSSLLALCIGGLMLPTFAELLASHNHQAQIVERGASLSVFIAVLLLAGYLASILFSVFRVGDKPSSDDSEQLDIVLGARSESAIARLLAYRQHIVKSGAPGKTDVLRQIDTTLHTIVKHETGQHDTPVTDTATKAPVAQSRQEAVKVGDAVVANKPGRPQGSPLPYPLMNAAKPAAKPNLWVAVLWLALATAGVAVLSEILVGSIEPLTKTLGWNAAFVGLIFVPLIAGVPEYFNTISMALDKRMEMVLAASAGSSIQIALLIAPILVLASLFAPRRLDLVFSIVELAVLGLTTFLFSEITHDGELVWLEGLLLMLLYAMMGGTVFLFGA
jgi:Ca2+:H+ antiporter